ncbi:MAG TPA: response regulator [Pirellulaceae bacterium]|nr:response regulator [Pirellulaceae bacterium]
MTDLDRHQLRIVVADDNQDAALTLSMLLDRLGFDVIAAVFDGESALECIRTERPHVAVLDIAMQGLDGLEVAQQARADAGAALRLVAVTGLGSACDRADALRAGFDAYFSKPVEGQKLEELMLAYLQSGIARPG